MSKLLLISTPVGNLEDITFRAKRVLGEVDFLACEDTRKTGLLLQNLEITHKPQLLSYYEENEAIRIPQIIRLLEENHDVGLVSNAGTPTISDPGFKLVRACVARGIRVEAIPGASAVLAGLVTSGLATDKFLFLGFLPQKQGKKRKILESLKILTREPLALSHLTIVVYESPYRLLRTLNDILDVCGDIEMVVGRELTKLHEEVKPGKVSDLLSYFEKNGCRGEFTLSFRL